MARSKFESKHFFIMAGTIGLVAWFVKGPIGSVLSVLMPVCLLLGLVAFIREVLAWSRKKEPSTGPEATKPNP